MQQYCRYESTANTCECKRCLSLFTATLSADMSVMWCIFLTA